MDRHPDIHVDFIDDEKISFWCEKHQKFHQHGSKGDRTNRSELRGSHCVRGEQYFLVVDSKTVRRSVDIHVYKKK